MSKIRKHKQKLNRSYLLNLKQSRQIKDDKDRKKHILENMIYMSELNPKNIFITRKIFGKEYKLNLYEGDSLKLDTKKEWGIDKFDVIIGNPPYNSDKKSSGNPIWQKFA